MRFVEALAFATDQLKLARVPSAESDAYWLICHAAGISRGELLTRMSFDLGLTDDQLAIFNSALERRLSREPLQHITGKAAFLDFELAVGPGVFVPRPETEGVVTKALELAPESTKLALDLGSGSGAIAISLARALPLARVIAVELDEDAARYTAANIAELAPQVELRVGDLADSVFDLTGQVDLLVSNPPYIPQDAIPLDPEVRDFDPPLALYSGADGLDAIREIIPLAQLLLSEEGVLVLEHADGQSEQVCELLLGAGFQKVLAHPDLAGRLRCVSATR